MTALTKEQNDSTCNTSRMRACRRADEPSAVRCALAAVVPPSHGADVFQLERGLIPWAGHNAAACELPSADCDRLMLFAVTEPCWFFQ